jgi:hypothetical protein
MQTTLKLQATWRNIVGKSTGKHRAYAQAGVRFASSTGQRPGTAAWYAAAIWRYNQY